MQEDYQCLDEGAAAAEDDNRVPLQKRIYDALYTSAHETAEIDPLRGIRDFVTVCGGDSLDIHPQEPWPQPIQLYQPYEVEQILLPDNANCLAVQAFLKMCNLDFQIEPRWNAEYMSPSGKVPFIKCGAFVVADFDNIVAFINSKGSCLSDQLTSDNKVNLRAYMSLVNTVLYNAELYVCWCHEDTYNSITSKRHGHVYPWPLNHLLNWQKRNQVMKRLGILSWASKSLEEVFEEVNKCCEALSERLEKKKYFFGENPNELDALVFAHIHTLAMSNFPPPTQDIATIIRRYPLLINHAYSINKQYFNRTPDLSIDSFEVIESSSEESLIHAFERDIFGRLPSPTYDRSRKSTPSRFKSRTSSPKELTSTLSNPKEIKSRLPSPKQFKSRIPSPKQFKSRLVSPSRQKDFKSRIPSPTDFKSRVSSPTNFKFRVSTPTDFESGVSTPTDFNSKYALSEFLD